MEMINSISSNQVNTASMRPEVAPQTAPQEQEAANPAAQDGFQSQEPTFAGYSKDVAALAKRVADSARCELKDVKVIAGTGGDDNIHISKGTNPGEMIVDINGQKTVVSGEEAGRTIIDGGKGNDTITVEKGLYQTMFITGGEGNDVITGGSGAITVFDNYGSNFITGSGCYDTIVANGYDLDPNAPAVSFPNAPSETGGITVNGNIIFGMGGNDYIEGSKANDYIDVGDGNNAAYGMGGNDFITSGKGDNYLSGGDGNDVIRAGNGKNIIVGGHGDDKLYGGEGQDVIIGGAGKDYIEDGKKGQYERANLVYANSQSTVAPSENDTITVLDNTSIPDNLVVVGQHLGQNPVTAAPGTDEFHQQNAQLGFEARVIDDLETLASLPSGQTMLNALGEAGKEVNFLPTLKGNSCKHFEGSTLSDDLRPGSGSRSEVNYNRYKISSGGLAIWSDRPPVVGLFHEMCHSYNAAMGNLDTRRLFDNGMPAQCSEDYMYTTPACEDQAVGIHNPAVTPNPKGLTENDLRADLNLRNRDAY